SVGAIKQRRRGKARPTMMREIAAPKLTRSIVAANVPPPFPMPAITPPTFPARVFDIRDHGAVPDDRTDCTRAIAAAIEACADAGGGRALIPPGQWLSGPIHLKSNIDHHLARGATVRFSADPDRYLPPVLVRRGGQECYNFSPF